jgi:hypothetical protein
VLCNCPKRDAHIHLFVCFIRNVARDYIPGGNNYSRW